MTISSATRREQHIPWSGWSECAKLLDMQDMCRPQSWSTSSSDDTSSSNTSSTHSTMHSTAQKRKQDIDRPTTLCATCTHVSEHSFTIAEPCHWNDLTLHFHDPQLTHLEFRWWLKIHLFCWGLWHLVTTAFKLPYKNVLTTELNAIFYAYHISQWSLKTCSSSCKLPK